MWFFERYKRFIRWGEVIAGLLLVVVGALIFLGNLDVLLRFVPESFYGFAR